MSEIKEIYDFAEKQGLLDFFKKKYNILLLGSSGVGKTQLISSLITQTPELIHHTNRTTHSSKSSLKIDKIPFNIIDTVGQDNRQSDRVKAIRDNLSSVNLLVNVVCYGYHEYARGAEVAFNKNGKLKQKYLQDNRKLEIEQLQEWTQILCGQEVPYKLITLVTKADIWWNEYDDVIKYYTEGDYYETLGNCQAIKPIVAHYSSAFHKLYDKEPLSGTFDETNKNQARKQLIQTIIESIGKGGEHV